MAVSARRAAGYRKFRDRRERAAPAFLPPLAWSASFSLVGCASFHLSPMSHHRTRHAPMCLEPEGRIHGKRCEHGIYDARSLHARRHPPSSVRRAVLWATLSHAVLVHVKARREEASLALPVTKARPAEPCRAAQRPGSSLPHMQSYRSGTRRLYGIPWRTVLRLVGCSSHLRGGERRPSTRICLRHVLSTRARQPTTAQHGEAARRERASTVQCANAFFSNLTGGMTHVNTCVRDAMANARCWSARD